MPLTDRAASTKHVPALIIERASVETCLRSCGKVPVKRGPRGSKFEAGYDGVHDAFIPTKVLRVSVDLGRR